ncbi:hypothetical protein [Tateyamaria sp. ANG-S1]|uniref:hypothetical protein n=1 Tax=Tateyamaria sp. ANG-S1 TaxID=1577905 RepID=UPI00057C49C4|nr:hypothetical protein [Tateyamaria sp. ANG-S1]KIC45480.1 hypothetical protein RA29_20845 [Tateyamaria sp. ANG-S1]
MKMAKSTAIKATFFDGAQPGHEVAVITKVASGKPMAFANFTTELVRDSKELTINTSIPATVFSAFVISLLAAIPGYFLWASLLDTVGLGRYAFSAIAFQIYGVVLVASVYGGLTIWSNRYCERSTALRREIDRLLVANTPQ